MSADETRDSPVKDQDARRAKRPFSKLRWLLIGLFFVNVVLVVASANLIRSGFIAPGANCGMLLLVLAGLHSTERYGFKNTAIFFAITEVVTLFFEALSIQTGYPFGLYHYTIPSVITSQSILFQELFQVPFVIILAYFIFGYFSWMLSHVLTGQYSKKLKGKWTVVVPFIAAFLMLMLDLSLDPFWSTGLSLWVWASPGAFFGVPIQNFGGWFLVVFIFYQLFALYLSKYDRIKPQKVNTLTSKPFWYEAAVVYGLMGLGITLIPITIYNDITVSMALVAVFTVIFVAIISFITITNNYELR
jgi:putative membrane protein